MVEVLPVVGYSCGPVSGFLLPPLAQRPWRRHGTWSEDGIPRGDGRLLTGSPAVHVATPEVQEGPMVTLKHLFYKTNPITGRSDIKLNPTELRTDW